MPSWILRAAGSGATAPNARHRNPVRLGIFEELGLLVIACGMGGMTGDPGDVIATPLIKDIRDYVGRFDATPAAALHFAHDEHRRRAAERFGGELASVLALRLNDQNAHVAFAGSCRMGRLREDCFEWLTIPDLLSHHLPNAEKIPDGMADMVVINSLGCWQELRLSELQLSLLQGDRLVLCSSGAAKPISNGPLPTATDEPSQAQRWVERCIALGSHEASCIVAQLHPRLP